jgi:putative SOS response-associated peptidase YedK
VQGKVTRMCERFTQYYTWKEIRDLYGMTARKPPTNMPSRYKICPTTMINAVRLVAGERIFAPMRWGLIPAWWLMGTEPTDRLTFNAPIETIVTAAFFRSAFKQKRCLIPASGYYEWQETLHGRLPYYFTRRKGSVMTIAGLWDEWRNPDTNELIRSCTMIIGEPSKFVAKVHNRMPVILEPTQFESWLSGEAGLELLKPAGEKALKKHPVSKRLGRSRTSDADETLIEKMVLPASNSPSVSGSVAPRLSQKVD